MFYFRATLQWKISTFLITHFISGGFFSESYLLAYLTFKPAYCPQISPSSFQKQNTLDCTSSETHPTTGDKIYVFSLSPSFFIAHDFANSILRISSRDINKIQIIITEWKEISDASRTAWFFGMLFLSKSFRLKKEAFYM